MWWSFLVAGLVLICLAWPQRSRAADPSLSEAVSAYENFEYEQALSLLEAILAKPGLAPSDRAKAHLYTGLTHFTLGDRAKAEREFKQALEADYQVVCPADTSPKILSAFDAVKKTVPPPEGVDRPPIDKGGPGPSPDPPPAITRPSPTRGRVWTWVAVGVGAAALAGGGLSAGLAAQAKGDFDDEPWAAKAADLKDTVETRALAANVLFGVGGAALLTGVILFFVEDTGPEAPETSAAWRILPGPLGVSARVDF